MNVYKTSLITGQEYNHLYSTEHFYFYEKESFTLLPGFPKAVKGRDNLDE